MMNTVKRMSKFLCLVSMLFAVSAVAATPQEKADKEPGSKGAYVKPHAPVEVRHKLLGPAVPGQPVEVEIILLPGRSAEAVSAEVRPGPGMRETRRGRAEWMSDPGRPLATRQVITFVPSVEGLHYITVFASVQIEGVRQGRVVAFPVQVGKSTKRVSKMLPSAGEVRADEDGGLVRELPAQQTIKEAEPE